MKEKQKSVRHLSLGRDLKKHFKKLRQNVQIKHLEFSVKNVVKDKRKIEKQISQDFGN